MAQGPWDADASPGPTAVSEQRRCKCFLLDASSSRKRSRDKVGSGGLCCALSSRQGTQVRPRAASRPTPNLLVSQPDDLGFGVALSSAGEEDGVPRGDVCVLGFGRDPGPFCTNKEVETFLVLNIKGSRTPTAPLMSPTSHRYSSCIQPQISPQSDRQVRPWETT